MTLPRWTRAVLAIAFAAVAAAVAHAQQPDQDSADPHAAQPERPTVATHAGTVAPGWTEIEMGVERDRYQDATHGGQAPILLKIGLAPRLQLSLQAFGIVAPGGTGQGIGDSSIGVKWRFAEHTRAGGNLALLPSIKLPTGAPEKGTGTGTTDAGLLLISSRSVNGIEIDLNVGYTRRYRSSAGTPRDAAVWTASFSGQPWGPVGWTAETFGYPSLQSGSESVVALLMGPTWEVRKFLVLDTGVIAPITGPQPRALYAGVTWNMGKLWNAAVPAAPDSAHHVPPRPSGRR